MAKATTQTAAERKLAEAQVRALITKIAPAHRTIVNAARRALRTRMPTAFEVVYEYRSWFVISYSASERGYEGVLAIRGSADGVRLHFNFAKDLPDPEDLLQGSSGQTRWVSLEKSSTLARPAVVSLIKGAIARSPTPFARTGRGPVLIRSAAPKKRASAAPKKRARARA